MKGVQYYDGLKLINKIIFEDQDLMNITESIYMGFKRFKTNAAIYDSLSEKLKDFYETHNLIELKFKLIEDSKYNSALLDAFDIRQYTGLTIIDYFQEAIQKKGVTYSVDELIAKSSYCLTSLKELKTVLSSSINSLDSIRQFQYDRFKNTYTNDLVLQVKVNQRFEKIIEFKSQIDRIDKIITSFKRVCEKNAPEDNIIYSIDDGSLILGLAVAAPVTLSILNCVEKCYDIKIKSEKLKQETLKSEFYKAIPPELQEEIAKKMIPELDSDKISDKLISEYHNSDSSENKNELKTLLIKAINDMFQFIINNGDINLLQESKAELLGENPNIKEKDLIIEALKSIDKAHEEIKLINKSGDIPLLENKNNNA